MFIPGFGTAKKMIVHPGPAHSIACFAADNAPVQTIIQSGDLPSLISLLQREHPHLL